MTPGVTPMIGENVAAASGTPAAEKCSVPSTQSPPAGEAIVLTPERKAIASVERFPPAERVDRPVIARVGVWKAG
jgi:hypothetical protein